jgi:signal transduction histidine kinase
MVVSQLRTVNAADPIREALMQVLHTLSRTLRLCYAHIEVNHGAQELMAVTLGTATKRHTVVVLRAGEHDLGRLLLDVQPDREPFGPKDARLLDEIGAQVGVVVETLLVNRDLRASQERIITIRDEERRRIRRDLHDDVLSQMAAQVLQVDSARSAMIKDPAAADAYLERLEDSIRSGIANVRRIVNGLGPTVLDRDNLISALRKLADDHNVQIDQDGSGPHRHLQYTIHADPVEPLPDAVKVAAYRIVSEALTNAARHSGGTLCQVRITRTETALAVSVTDNGCGFKRHQSPGIGLDSMTNRAEEVGGSLTITTRAGAGTTIAATLPIAPWRSP